MGNSEVTFTLISSQCNIAFPTNLPMYTKKKYSLRDIILWTRYEIIYFLILALAVTLLNDVVGLKWLQLPWTPVALVGTAVAFLIGFQNNAAYGRAWEARKIWGGIVNESRTFATMVGDMVTNEYAKEQVTQEELLEHQRKIVYRHLAWLTALRYAMRTKRPWEVFTEHRTNKEWHEKICIPERDGSVDEELSALLAPNELEEVTSKTNHASAILVKQSAHLRELKERGLIWEFSFLELESLIRELFALQGKSERIKNFPYPRQYATLGYDFVRVFILLLPFGVIPEFSRIGANLTADFPTIGPYFVWLGIPFTIIVSWIFNTMQRIGIVGENPFEGSANDVPISTMARTIEIDLREILGESSETIPEPYPIVDGVQM